MISSSDYNIELKNFGPVLELDSAYASEKLDPFHPYGRNKAYQVWQKTRTNEDFLSWLSKQDAGLKRQYYAHQVTYCKEEEIEKFLFLTKDVTKNEISSHRRRYMFVVGLDERIYHAKRKPYVFHHSSFFAGKDILSAGELIYIGKKLYAVTDNCGHYKPKPEHMLKALECLDKLGIDLANIYVVLNSYPGAKEPTISYNASDYLKHQGPPPYVPNLHTQNYLPPQGFIDRRWLGVGEKELGEAFFKQHGKEIWCLRFSNVDNAFHIHYRTFSGIKEEKLLIPDLDPETTPFNTIIDYVEKQYGPRWEMVKEKTKETLQGFVSGMGNAIIEFGNARLLRG